MSTVVHPAMPARKRAARATRWWAKAWVRAVEEASYAAEDLTRARAISRSGRIGQISLEPGRFVAAVEDENGLWAVLGTLPVLDEQTSEALVETVAAEAGRIAELLAGQLPHTLVEHAEEAGVELLPYGGEFGGSCTCDAWTDPCPHALAVMYQLAWLMEDDPFVLLHLRGLSREELLARLHDRSGSSAGRAGGDAEAGDLGGDLSGDLDAELAVDLDVAADAAARAAAMLAELDLAGAAGGDPQGGERHLGE